MPYRLSLSNARSYSTSNINSNSISTSTSTRARARAPSTASAASSINAHTFSRSPNATPMHLPKKRQSAIPSLGLARSQSISVVGGSSVAGDARKSLPAQTQPGRAKDAFASKCYEGPGISISGGVPLRAPPHVDTHDHAVAGCSAESESESSPRTPKSKDHLAVDDAPASRALNYLADDQLHFAIPRVSSRARACRRGLHHA
ncbi:hypothetical protein DXG01_006841 [Tephrocybe rancida]|nr:hypothetical protein DXG01_006841 [Tephrocybe rancida]